MPAPTREKSALAPLIEKAIAHCGGRQEDLARRMGCAQQTVSKLLYGEVPLTPEHAIAIHRATDGEVSGSELRPDLWQLPEHVPAAPPMVPAQLETAAGVCAS